MSVDVEAAARAVMADDGPWLAWEDASGSYRDKCRRIAEAVLALVAEEQTDLHAVVDALRSERDDLLARNAALRLRGPNEEALVGMGERFLARAEKAEAENRGLHAVVDAAREVDDWLQGNGAALGCAPRLHAALAPFVEDKP